MKRSLKCVCWLFRSCTVQNDLVRWENDRRCVSSLDLAYCVPSQAELDFVFKAHAEDARKTWANA